MQRLIDDSSAPTRLPSSAKRIILMSFHDIRKKRNYNPQAAAEARGEVIKGLYGERIRANKANGRSAVHLRTCPPEQDGPKVGIEEFEAAEVAAVTPDQRADVRANHAAHDRSASQCRNFRSQSRGCNKNSEKFIDKCEESDEALLDSEMKAAA
ncbi:hypothetical protein KIN20_031956 [Parelaphostrongylus tenuis]|uniref:Uncharacterized protein n=1 Tax=Parelaphostrongylus tenuis TaxID=148309 RepID=A0AAD5WHN5_PARTN|nr:hypothetical protein KIN20_031956 [Parelaphostrongylus tenuis]